MKIDLSEVKTVADVRVVMSALLGRLQSYSESAEKQELSIKLSAALMPKERQPNDD